MGPDGAGARETLKNKAGSTPQRRPPGGHFPAEPGIDYTRETALERVILNRFLVDISSQNDIPQVLDFVDPLRKTWIIPCELHSYHKTLTNGKSANISLLQTV